MMPLARTGDAGPTPALNSPTRPKKVLLVLNYSMQEETPQGNTLRSFMELWPASDVCEIFRFPPRVPVQRKLPIGSHPVPARATALAAIVARLRRGPHDRSLPTPFTIDQDNGVRLQISQLLKYFRDTCVTFPDRSKLMQEIRAFAPDVIYTVGESTFAVSASLRLSRRIDIPVVVHYMDDWPETLFSNRGLARLPRALFRRKLKELQRRCRYALVISPLMLNAYDERYPGIEHRILANVVAATEPTGNPPIAETGAAVEFVYLGGLHLNRWRGLLELQRVLLELLRSGTPVRLIIYTPDQDRHVFEREFDFPAELRGYVPHEEVPGVLDRADVLVHVESFVESDVAYTRYSLSTKLPECMARGKPILYFGPSHVASADYVRKSGAGLVCDSPVELARAARALASSRRMRQKMGRSGQETAALYHSSQYAASVLAEALA